MELYLIIPVIKCAELLLIIYSQSFLGWEWSDQLLTGCAASVIAVNYLVEVQYNLWDF